MMISLIMILFYPHVNLSLFVMITLMFFWSLSRYNLKVIMSLLMLEFLMLSAMYLAALPFMMHHFTILSLFTIYTFAVGEACMGLSLLLSFFRSYNSSMFLS